MRMTGINVEEETKILGRPPVVVLCGSTRFYEEFQKANFDFTMEGFIVLTVGFYPHAEFSKKAHGEDVGVTPEQKEKLDELHKRKIEMADYAYILNKNGYLGKSTMSEIGHCNKIGTPTYFLEGDAH